MPNWFLRSLVRLRERVYPCQTWSGPSETERQSHYFDTRLPAQFDAVIHLDRTRALIPLEKTVPWEAGEVPETYPSAL